MRLVLCYNYLPMEKGQVHPCYWMRPSGQNVLYQTFIYERINLNIELNWIVIKMKIFGTLVNINKHLNINKTDKNISLSSQQELIQMCTWKMIRFSKSIHTLFFHILLGAVNNCRKGMSSNSLYEFRIVPTSTAYNDFNFVKLIGPMWQNNELGFFIKFWDVICIKAGLLWNKFRIDPERSSTDKQSGHYKIDEISGSGAVSLRFR